LRLEGKRALVTGSSRGLGAEIARLFAREGAQVAVNYRSSKSEADAVVQSIAGAGGKAIEVACDVSDPASVATMFRAVGRSFGGLDILVNNAGLADRSIWNVSLEETTLAMWRRVFDVDAFGTFNCTQAAARLMKHGGSIVNIASTPAVAGDAEGLVYASAKGAVLSMTRMLARTLAPRIRVNCMVFGSFETGWLEWLDEKQVRGYRSAIPLKRFGTPTDAAQLALFLASDESGFITGQAVVADGGEVMR